MAAQGARGNVPIICPGGKKHFDVEPGSVGTVRVPCRDRRCRHTQNEVVIHYFDLATGELKETKRYLKTRSDQPVA